MIEASTAKRGGAFGRNQQGAPWYRDEGNADAERISVARKITAST
ncbi:hypothetical protein [Singulisphaera sp. GP187]|nr:hypothetical protein [Singulisphaera sp. GP187]